MARKQKLNVAARLCAEPSWQAADAVSPLQRWQRALPGATPAQSLRRPRRCMCRFRLPTAQHSLHRLLVSTLHRRAQASSGLRVVGLARDSVCEGGSAAAGFKGTECTLAEMAMLGGAAFVATVGTSSMHHKFHPKHYTVFT